MILYTMQTARRNIVHCACTLTFWRALISFKNLCCTFCVHFTRQYQYHLVFCFVSAFDRSLLRLTNKTSSCYELQMIYIVPLYFTLLRYCNTGFRFLSLYRCTSFDDRKFLNTTINFHYIVTRKFSPNIGFCIRWVNQRRLWLWYYFRPSRQNLIRPWKPFHLMIKRLNIKTAH
jgi:hypothetical protein